MLYKRHAINAKCSENISLVMILIEITNQGSKIGKIYCINIFRLKCSKYHLKIDMYRLCAVNNPFVISRNHSGDLKQ